MTSHNIHESAEQELPTETDVERPKNRPFKSGFHKGVSWAIFPKVIKLEDGTELTVYNTVIEGRFKDKGGEYRSTSVFTENQLVAVEDAAREARRLIREESQRRRAK